MALHVPTVLSGKLDVSITGGLLKWTRAICKMRLFENCLLFLGPGYGISTQADRRGEPVLIFVSHCSASQVVGLHICRSAREDGMRAFAPNAQAEGPVHAQTASSA